MHCLWTTFPQYDSKTSGSRESKQRCDDSSNRWQEHRLLCCEAMCSAAVYDMKSWPPVSPRHHVWWAWPDPKHLPDPVLLQHTCPRIQPLCWAAMAMWFIPSNFLLPFGYSIILYNSVCVSVSVSCCWRRSRHNNTSLCWPLGLTESGDKFVL